MDKVIEKFEKKMNHRKTYYCRICDKEIHNSEEAIQWHNNQDRHRKLKRLELER